ncbi:MAG: hypothetical protein JST68_08275 [Bacteroidetes bacterium]|nr:hypothetical protein [Bacteroidota bacterium]
MKQLAAILLVGILFFNWYGYQLLSNYWQGRSNQRLEATLDQKNYDESQLISLKAPITSLSYYNSSTTFERVDGQITIGGIEYKYVERRIFKDSMEYRCIPNQVATNLKKATNEYFQLVNDLSHNGQEKKTPHSGVYKSISQDYCASEQTAFLPDAGVVLTQQTAIPVAAQLPSSYSPTAEMPPDQALALS